MELDQPMAKVLDRSLGVASPVELAKATLDAELPHGRRQGEPNGLRPLAVWRAWRRRRAARHELHWIDAHLLRDAGLDPIEARAEARKPFWWPITLDRADPPSRRRHDPDGSRATRSTASPGG
jgi:uncharacterized protein YjiS (DUF1127 family)